MALAMCLLVTGCTQPASAPPLPHVVGQLALDSGVHVAGLAVSPAGSVWIAALNYGSGPSGAIEILVNGQERRFQRIESFNRGAVDAAGTAWFTVGAGASGQQPKLVRVSPAGQMHDYPLPEEGNFEGIAIGPDGVPWFVDAAAGDIGRIAPDGSISYYGPASGDPTEIALSTDGSLWFTESSSNKVGRVTSDGSVTEYALPTLSSHPTGITAGRAGVMWFCESAADKIGRISTQGRVVEFAVPTKDAWPLGIAGARNGDLWFTELMVAKVGRITPAGRIEEFAAPGGGYPGPIVRAPDGSLWMASNAKRDAVLGLTSTRSRLVHFDP
jgi:streptogramin lyase